MAKEELDTYTKAVRRLARTGIEDPTAQIIALEKEIDHYRKQIMPHRDGYKPTLSLVYVAEVKHGEWVHSNRGFDVQGDYECSNCHSPSGIKRFYSGNKYIYCPDCGAKMDGGSEANR